MNEVSHGPPHLKNLGSDQITLVASFFCTGVGVVHTDPIRRNAKEALVASRLPQCLACVAGWYSVDVQPQLSLAFMCKLRGKCWPHIRLVP